jgi:hypothetical protein
MHAGKDIDNAPMVILPTTGMTPMSQSLPLPDDLTPGRTILKQTAD